MQGLFPLQVSDSSLSRAMWRCCGDTTSGDDEQITDNLFFFLKISVQRLCWGSVLPMILVTATLAVLCLASASDVVVVSDATGRTGSLIGKALKEQDENVRGFIRNATKTREKLGRIACDASEGILVGDVTDPSTLIAPMVGVHSLMIGDSRSSP